MAAARNTPAWLAWLLLGLAALLVFGPQFAALLRPGNLVRDFFQDYTSARFHATGISPYASLEGEYQRQFGKVGDDRRWHYGRANPHAPASLLPVLPLAAFDYPTAALYWNLFNLACIAGALLLIAGELKWPTGLAGLLLTVAVLLPFSPLYGQVLHAQNNGVVLLLLVWFWSCLRHGKDEAAGLFLGLATALKLLPGLLLIYLLLRRRWLALAWATLAFGGMQVLAWFLFGTADFRFWLEHLAPHTAEFRTGWLNQSLHGYWARLWEPSVKVPGSVPLLQAPWVGQILAYGFSLGLVLLLVPPTLRPTGDDDRVVGLWVTTMLLVSPLTWDHYLLLALLPLAILWNRLPDGTGWAVAFGAVVSLLWLHPAYVWNRLVPGGFAHGTALPWQSATFISYKFFGLLLLFAIQWKLLPREPARPLI